MQNKGPDLEDVQIFYNQDCNTTQLKNNPD